MYRSPHIVRVIKSRRLRWAGHISRIEEIWSAIKILTGKPTETRPLEGSRRRWDDNIRANLRELDISTRNLIDSTKHRDYRRALVDEALNLRVP